MSISRIYMAIKLFSSSKIYIAMKLLYISKIYIAIKLLYNSKIYIAKKKQRDIFLSSTNRRGLFQQSRATMSKPSRLKLKSG